MKSIRNFAYASLLTLSALNFAPSLASAQNVAGRFKLPHDVRWQNAMIPAGDYKFTVETKGASELLTLSKVSGSSAGYMLMVTDSNTNTHLSDSRIIMVVRGGKSFVREMELPELGMTLNFPVPTESEVKTELASSSAGSR
jgi:hypothetical protein